jgi:Cu/Ag efflux protein CusF
VNKTLSAVILAAALSLAGCSSGTPSDIPAPAPAGASGASGQTAIKRYPMHGKVVSVNAAEKSVKIDAGPIGDWMGAMTMNYTIKDDADLARLTPGTTFDATVVVNGDDFWVAEVKPAK